MGEKSLSGGPGILLYATSLLSSTSQEDLLRVSRGAQPPPCSQPAATSLFLALDQSFPSPPVAPQRAGQLESDRFGKSGRRSRDSWASRVWPEITW